MSLSKEELNKLRHTSELPRFFLTLFVLIPLGFFIAILTVASLGIILIYVPLVILFIWLITKISVAHYMNNMVLVSEKSFPEIHEVIKEASIYFGYENHVEAYVYEEGSYNVVLLALLRRKVLLLNSEVLVADNNVKEVRFLVGRFVGALASKHYRFLWLSAFLNAVERLYIFNLLLYPYERAIQYSGDQLGLYFVNGDLETVVKSLIKSVVGQDIEHRVSVDGFIEQGIMSRGSFFSWIARAFSQFPHTTYRVANIIRFSNEQFPDTTGEYIGKFGTDTSQVMFMASHVK